MNRMKRIIIAITFFGICGWSTLASPTQMQEMSFVHVLKVIDGDSFLALLKGEQVEIRFWGIDCPEWNQPFAHNAKKITRQMLEGNDVQIWVKDRDRYGRLVAMVFLNNTNVNEELVRSGSAWVYSRYCNEQLCNRWNEYQHQAAKAKRGLWSQPNVVPPWQWRQRPN